MSDAHVIAVIQARMSSRRLPGKVLTKIGALTTLEMVTRRLARAEQIDAVVLATSVEASDDPVAQAATNLPCQLIRGPLDDVLGRFTGALEEHDAEAVLRVTADCPLVDPGIVDALVALWRETRADYVSNVIEPFSFPMGLNVEVISAGALRRTAAEASDAADREHVTTYVRARPEEFRSEGLWMDPPKPDAVVTLDSQEDLERLRELIAEIGDNPSLPALLGALGGSPDFQFRGLPPA